MTTIILLAVFGIVAILLEFVLPGGILGLAGAGCMVAAVGLTFAHYGALAGGIALVAILIFFGVALSIWMSQFHRLPITKLMVLKSKVGGDQGNGGSITAADGGSLVGQTGTTLTDLLPSGKATIGGAKYDVVSETGPIEKGTEVRVESVSTFRIVVRATS